MNTLINKSNRLWLILLAMLGLAADARATFITVDFSTFHNARMQSFQSEASQYPEGDNTILGGVPFDIPAGGNNAWIGNGNGSSPVSITVPVAIDGVDKIHTLISTAWGQPGPNSYSAIRFQGTGGLDYTRYLYGNSDIRDHLFGFWINNINGTTTVNVFSSSGGFGSQVRLDKQEIDLPDGFLSETLTSIQILDTGADNFHRTLVMGITAETVPSVPEVNATWMLLGLGSLSLIAFKRRAKTS
jgi:hypothetical protein